MDVVPQGAPTWAIAQAAQRNGYCAGVGAPYPCRPHCDPRTTDMNGEDTPMGAPIPVERIKGCKSYDEAVKRLCWVETTLRSPAQVAAAASIIFTIEAKWWWQIQKIINYGDQVNATFDLVDIRYGQSNYSLELHRFEIDNVGVAQSGIDVRRWNFEMFDKFYPMPASGLNDEIDLTFTNVSAQAADIELGVGGPAVLQIG